MKTKILLLVFFYLTAYSVIYAQFSFSNLKDDMRRDGSNISKSLSEEVKKDLISLVEKSSILESVSKPELIKVINSAKSYDEVEMRIDKSSLKEEDKDSFKAQAFDIVSKYEEKNNAKGDVSLRRFFPARFNENGSVVSTDFFEGKENYTQIFQNNNVVYNPNLKNLSFNSEVVNDYLGPLRVGIGFQFSSTVKNDDSIAASEVNKDKLVASLQNGGGNLFVNIKYPFIAIGEESNSFGFKSFFYHNSGVELTKINEADNDFVLTNNTGITLGAFGSGKDGKISAFLIAKGSILYGNSKYNKILAADERFKKALVLLNIGVGINFSDMYTVKAEFYSGGEYIKRNFPATISFVIVPKK